MLCKTQNILDKAIAEETKITIRSQNSAEHTVYITLSSGSSFTSEILQVYSNKPINYSETVIIETDLSYAGLHDSGSAYTILPEAFYNIDKSTLVLDAGSTGPIPVDISIYATNPYGNKLPAGHYLLPLSFKTMTYSSNTESLVFDITIREPFESDAQLYEGDDLLFVFYVNTGVYNPMLISDYYMAKQSFFGEEVWYGAIGNIINLRSIPIRLSKEHNRIMLNPTSDMRYVLDNMNVFIAPLQESERKICVCLEADTRDVGFCCLSSEQIEDLAIQIKQLVEYYNLDGINLWDKNTAYGAEASLPVDTKSYPLLLKRLREVLGKEKLITLVDYEYPTSYFGDLDATGGICVGDYIDYAWSGYNRYDEGYQIVDPYHQGEPMVSSAHTREPIAGLPASHYGCINAPWARQANGQMADVWETSGQKIIEWVQAGYKQSNICIYEDAIGNIQDNTEGAWSPQELVWYIANDSFVYGGSYVYVFDSSRLREPHPGFYGYNKWLKDW